MYMRFPGGRDRALTFSYDDGVTQDERLVALFDRYGVKGTFNINAGLFRENQSPRPDKLHVRLSAEEALALYAENPSVEVACHGYTHAALGRVSSAAAMYEVVEDRRGLESLFGRLVQGMAYAYGTTDDAAVEVLRHAGIHYSRTTVSTRRFDIPKDWLRLPATCHHNDPALMELAESFLAPKNDSPRLFYVWGHSYEFDANDNWQRMEDFLAAVSGHEEIWYATNGEIYDYVRAYEGLEWSADMTLCKNPGVQDVWVQHSRDCLCIPAGSTVRLPL